MKKSLTIALVGNPNCGKTSLFNALTGLNQKVSNFHGTTVEKKTGNIKLSPQLSAQIIDLPGTYSLYPKSADEFVTYELLRNKCETDVPDTVVFVADASNLKRNLLLLTQTADLGVPVVLALNMNDVAERRGIFYDLPALSQALNIPVVSINARARKGIDELKQVLANYTKLQINTYLNLDTNPELINSICALTKKKSHYAAMQAAINTFNLKLQGAEELSRIFEATKFDVRAFQENEVLSRYKLIDQAVRISRKQTVNAAKQSLTKKLDAIITHRVGGIVLFLALLFLVFQAIFSWSSLPMQWVESIFVVAQEGVDAILPDGKLKDLLINGVLAGLGGVMVFLPQIVILFLFIAILEDIGYMSRVAFLMDRIMRPFGLNGKSIVPLISGMACAVPSIMATRGIENKKERLITILVIPLMSCSARLPVYTLLIGMLLPITATLGPFNMQGLILMGMYLLGFALALLSAIVFKVFIKQPVRNYFLMELPGYKLPVWSNIVITLKDKSWAFIWGAGRIIVAVSIILWALASYGPGNSIERIEEKYAQIAQIEAEELDQAKATELLQASYAGQFGRFIEPIIKPLGYDWKIGIALLTSLAAREVFVGTMSTIYSVGGDVENLAGVREKMMAETDENGNKTYSFATILSLMIFYAIALQCMSTVSVVRSETQSTKWTLIQFTYLTLLAWISSFTIFQLFS
jgi:ferrous iron transport protein B